MLYFAVAGVHCHPPVRLLRLMLLWFMVLMLLILLLFLPLLLRQLRCCQHR